MSDILKRWIEGKLGLPFPHHEDLELQRRALSNGYLIGEIIRKYNIISDDQSVSLKRSVYKRDRVNNFKHLQNWLENAGVRDFKEFQNIIDEKPGSATRFLFQLYIWLESPKSLELSGLLKSQDDTKITASVKSPGGKIDNVPDQVSGKNQSDISREEGNDQDDDENDDLDGTIQPRPSIRSSIAKDNLDGNQKLLVMDKKINQNQEKVGESKKPRSSIDNQSIPANARVRKGSIKYKNLELQKLPPLMLNKIPYGKMPEESQAQALYFADRSQFILKNIQKEEVLRRISSQKMSEERVIISSNSDEFDEPYPNVELEESLNRSLLEMTSRAKGEPNATVIAIHELEAYQEMNNFDEKLNALSSGDSAVIDEVGELTELKKELKVYKDGKGSEKDFEDSLARLKWARAEESRASEWRANCRKKYMSQVVQGVTRELYNGLEDEILELVANIPLKERHLADFIRSSHQEKQNFIAHRSYEAEQERIANQEILYNQNADNENKTKLVEKIATSNEEFLNDEKSRLNEDLSAEYQNKINRRITDGIMRDMIKLTVLIAKYRKENNKSDPPPELLDQWKLDHFAKFESSFEDKDYDGALLAGVRESYVDSSQLEYAEEGKEKEKLVLAQRIDDLLTTSAESLFETTNIIHVSDLVFAISDPKSYWRPSKVLEALKPISEEGTYKVAIIQPRKLVHAAIRAYQDSQKSEKSQIPSKNQDQDPYAPWSEVETDTESEFGSTVDPSESSMLSEAEGNGPDQYSVIQQGYSDSMKDPERRLSNEPSQWLSKLSGNVEDRIKKSKKKKRREKRHEKKRPSEAHKSTFYLYKTLLKAPERYGSDDNPQEIADKGQSLKTGDKEPPKVVTKIHELDSDSDEEIVQDNSERIRELGQIAQEVSLKGQVIDDAVISELLALRIEISPENSIQIIMNFPNTKCQLKYLEKYLIEKDVDLKDCK